MSVESEILRIQQNIANAYSAVSSKGGQVPLRPTSENLSDAINTIPSGGGSSGGNPVGTVISFLGTSAPAGYLVCDGAVKNISDYPALSSFFEAQFGSKNCFGGNGTSTFAVPDMRNLFLRGYHGDAAALSGDVGKKQEGTCHPNTQVIGNFIFGRNVLENIQEGYTYSVKNSDTENNVGASTYTFVEGPASEKGAATYTARPVNMAVLYCIKAS